MTLSTIISITISLTFIYLVLSIVTSEIQEIISNFFNLRAKNLQQSVINLLGEQQKKSNLLENILNDIWQTKKDTNNFPITHKIYDQYLTPYLDTSTKKNSKFTAITNIQSQKFAHALISIVKEVLECETQRLNYNQEQRLSLENEIVHEERLNQIIEDIKTSSLPEKLKIDFSYLLKKNQNKLKKTEKKIQSLEKEVQDWFDKSMEYSSEIYKKKAKIISFILGMILVLLFNVDTINIINKLSKSEVLVSEFNSLAREIIESNSNLVSCSKTQNEVNIQTCITDIQDQLNIASDSIDNLPIGWNLSAPFKEQFSPLNISNVFNAIVGWLISAVAISMGAPFWFTVLRNLMDFKLSQTSQANQAKA